jgi:hypothetical protein
LSIKLDYYTKYYSGRLSTYKFHRTIVAVGAQGCWQCLPVQPRRAPPPASLWPLPLLQQR